MNTHIGQRPARNLPLAILCVAVFSVFYSLLGATVKEAVKEVSVESIAFWRCFVGAFILFIWICLLPPHRKPLSFLKTAQWKMQLVRSLSGLLANVFYFCALKTLPITDATLLLCTNPIFIPIIFYLWYRISIHHEIWWGMAVAFIGIGIVLNPGKEIFHPGALWGLLSGISAAVAYVSLRMSHYSEPSERTLFWNLGIGSLAMLIVSFFFLKTTWLALNLTNLPWLLLIGFLAFAAQIMVTLAAKHAPMRFLSPFFFLTVVFGAFLDRWIWKTDLMPHVFWGSALVILGNILMVVLYPKEDPRTG